MKLYMNLNSPETVVRNATERYNEERYKFYKQMERLVPLIEELGRLKLSTWSKYTAMFDTLDKLINLPVIIPIRATRTSTCCPRMCASCGRWQTS